MLIMLRKYVFYRPFQVMFIVANKNTVIWREIFDEDGHIRVKVNKFAELTHLNMKFTRIKQNYQLTIRVLLDKLTRKFENRHLLVLWRRSYKSEKYKTNSVSILNYLFYCIRFSSGRSTNCGQYFRKILRSKVNSFKELFNNFDF